MRAKTAEVATDAPDTAAFELGYWFPGVELPATE